SRGRLSGVDANVVCRRCVGSAVVRDEPVRADREDDPYGGVRDRVAPPVPLLQRLVERRLGIVVVDLLDGAADLQEPVRIRRVGDRQRHPGLALEVAVLLPGLRVGHADPFAVPDEPHDLRLRGTVGPHRREVREHRLVEKVDMTGRDLSVRHAPSLARPVVRGHAGGYGVSMVTGGASRAMRAAATALRDSVAPDIRDRMVLPFDHAQRRWLEYRPEPRPGVTLGDLAPAARKNAHRLLATALSPGAYAQAMAIVALEEVLDRAEGWRGGRHSNDY